MIIEPWQFWLVNHRTSPMDMNGLIGETIRIVPGVTS